MAVTLKDVLRELVAFRDERGWAAFHTPPNLAAAISIEAAELLECFQWGTPWRKNDVAEEVADVLIYALSMCEALGVDPATIIRDKMAKNAEKYPADEWRGRAW